MVVSRVLRLAVLLAVVWSCGCRPPYSGPTVVVKPQSGGVPTVQVMTYEYADFAKGRATLDLRCWPEQIRVSHVATFETKEGFQQMIYFAQGCGQVARYACVPAELGPWCTREPIVP